MTAQVPDVLHYQGERFSLFSNPLEAAFDDDRPRPAFEWSSTANWRGYIATWAIEDDVLYLTEFQAKIAGKSVGLESVFPEEVGPVMATWFRGRLRVPQGEQLEYSHMGYGSIYERDLFLAIHEGQLILEELFDTQSNEMIQSRLTRHGRSLFGPDEWAFIEAVRADLKDEISRRVYADWLEERGDGRAEMLRLECQSRRSGSEAEAEPLWNRMEGLYAEQARKGNTLDLWMRLMAMPLRPRLAPSVNLDLLHP